MKTYKIYFSLKNCNKIYFFEKILIDKIIQNLKIELRSDRCKSFNFSCKNYFLSYILSYFKIRNNYG